MRRAAPFLTAVLSCLALPGCYISTYGVQSNSGGATTTTTASKVSGSASFPGGRVAFSSGQVPPPGAPGGHAYLGNGGSALVVTGVVLADFLNYIRGEPRPKELPADTKIMGTCSCYKKPVMSDE
jgi:hypothetical protein